ncbi:hypothetical protein LTS17_012223 [Exophiala oligosperma]
MVGARPMSIMIEGEVIKAFGVYVSWAWGMTESTCVGNITLPDTRNVSGSWMRTENEVLGGPCELYLRDPQVILDYWFDEKTTKKTIMPDGWLSTGDLTVVKDSMW